MIGNRVVVTGLGAVTPVGLDVGSTWQAICAGQSGAALIDTFDAEAFTTRFSCSVKGFSAEGYFPAKDAKRMDPFIQFGMVAGIQALRDSGFEITDDNCDRVGCAIGSGIGGIGSIEYNNELIARSGPRRISPFFVPGAIINMISGNLSVMYNMQGPNLAVVTACTSGTHNIGLGARLIASGEVDAMLVGGPRWQRHPWVSVALLRQGHCLHVTKTLQGLPDPGTRTETDLCLAMEQPCCCLNPWTAPVVAGRRFTPS